MKDFVNSKLKYCFLAAIVVCFAVLSLISVNFYVPNTFYQTGELRSTDDRLYYNSLCFEINYEENYSLNSIWINFGSIDYTEEYGAELEIFTSLSQNDTTNFYATTSFSKVGTGNVITNDFESIKPNEWQVMCSDIQSGRKTAPYFLISTKFNFKINEIAFLGENTNGKLKVLTANPVGAGAKNQYSGTDSPLNKSLEFARDDNAKALALKVVDETGKFDVKAVSKEDLTYSVNSGMSDGEKSLFESVRNLTTGRGNYVDLTVNPFGQYLLFIGTSLFGACGLRCVSTLFALLSIMILFLIGELIFDKSVYSVALSFLFAAGNYALSFAAAGGAETIFVFFLLVSAYLAIKFIKRGISKKHPAKGYINVLSAGACFAFAFAVNTTAVFYFIPFAAIIAYGVYKQYRYAKTKGETKTAEYKRKATNTISFSAIGYVIFPVIVCLIPFIAGYSAYSRYLEDSNVLSYSLTALAGVFKTDGVSPFSLLINYSAESFGANKYAFGNIVLSALNIISLIYCAVALTVRFVKNKDNPLTSKDGNTRVFIALIIFFAFGFALSFTVSGASGFFAVTVVSGFISVYAFSLLDTEYGKTLKLGKISVIHIAYIVIAACVLAAFTLAVPALIGLNSSAALYSWQVLGGIA